MYISKPVGPIIILFIDFVVRKYGPVTRLNIQSRRMSPDVIVLDAGLVLCWLTSNNTRIHETSTFS